MKTILYAWYIFLGIFGYALYESRHQAAIPKYFQFYDGISEISCSAGNRTNCGYELSNCKDGKTYACVTNVQTKY